MHDKKSQKIWPIADPLTELKVTGTWKTILFTHIMFYKQKIVLSAKISNQMLTCCLIAAVLLIKQQNIMFVVY